MITDANMTLWAAVALTGSTSYVSSSYDTASTTNDVAAGEPMEGVLQVDVAATNAGTYVIDLVESAAATLTSPTVLATKTIAYTALTAGARFRFPIPAGQKVLRYLGFKLTNTGGAVTFTGWLSRSADVQQIVNYPAGSSIS